MYLGGAAEARPQVEPLTLLALLLLPPPPPPPLATLLALEALGRV